jgi:hypothetical protein
MRDPRGGTVWMDDVWRPGDRKSIAHGRVQIVPKTGSSG